MNFYRYGFLVAVVAFLMLAGLGSQNVRRRHQNVSGRPVRR